LNGTHHLLVCADGINLLGENIHTVKEKKQALFVTNKQTNLEVNAEKTECIFVSREQNVEKTAVLRQIISCLEV
jgi:hypothetical protein